MDINANLAEDYLKDFDMSQPYMKEFVDEIYEILWDSSSNSYTK